MPSNAIELAWLRALRSELIGAGKSTARINKRILALQAKKRRARAARVRAERKGGRSG